MQGQGTGPHLQREVEGASRVRRTGPEVMTVLGRIRECFLEEAVSGGTSALRPGSAGDTVVCCWLVVTCFSLVWSRTVMGSRVS